MAGNVRLLSEVEEAERAKLVLHAVEPSHDDKETASPPKETPPGRLELIELMGTLARILGFRVQLLLAFIGAVGLSGWAVAQHDALALTAAALYNATVLLPILFVAYRRG